MTSADPSVRRRCFVYFMALVSSDCFFTQHGRPSRCSRAHFSGRVSMPPVSLASRLYDTSERVTQPRCYNTAFSIETPHFSFLNLRAKRFLMADQDLFELLNLAIDSPAGGVVNFKTLHVLLDAMLQRIGAEEDKSSTRTEQHKVALEQPSSLTSTSDTKVDHSDHAVTKVSDTSV